MIRHAVPAAAFFALALLTASAAQALTLEGKASTPGGATSAQIADPSDRLTSGYSSGGKTVIQNGNTTLQFGAQRERSFNQRYDFNNQFDRYDAGSGR